MALGSSPPAWPDPSGSSSRNPQLALGATDRDGSGPFPAPQHGGTAGSATAGSATASPGQSRSHHRGGVKRLHSPSRLPKLPPGSERDAGTPMCPTADEPSAAAVASWGPGQQGRQNPPGQHRSPTAPHVKCWGGCQLTPFLRRVLSAPLI